MKIKDLIKEAKHYDYDQENDPFYSESLYDLLAELVDNYNLNDEYGSFLDKLSKQMDHNESLKIKMTHLYWNETSDRSAPDHLSSSDYRSEEAVRELLSSVQRLTK